MARQASKLEPQFVPVPTVSNTAAVVVSFFPDSEFEKHLKELDSQFDAVFWVDNTPRQTGEVPRALHATIRCIATGENTGLADALNRGCREAVDAGYSWAVTFDQDSSIAADLLEQQIACWHLSLQPVFMLGCNYTDSADTRSPRFKSGRWVTTCRTVITSGSLMCLPVWRELGEFRGDYFIDGIDHEVCLRARQHGLVVARHGLALMQHQIGERSSAPGFLPYRQPAERMYYSTRNGIRNIRAFALSEPLWAARRFAAILWEGLAAVLLGPKGLGRFRAVASGFVDGVRGATGPARKSFK
ncbi:MAG: glycosyltransferase [Gammaproteobacteria bacterium]|nr:glycosyltransferase [Gammaproteobacteria bacterium]